ncbi:unnamed protein product [Eruca vesicaria subsp. sativa]|uniref:RING-type E3 ubiquitin transferase n=1 Tax=Eruca vesicaria subsp. sativa TaxID=29727 RepID=A0ABC8M577_ERUVS|nr:unnamed protein product [Eruca vesicaria subsp. sativa]
MDLGAAGALCLGFGFFMRILSSSKTTLRTSDLLRRAILVNDLKGLEECFENKEIKNPTVLVRGTVGSNSTVENSCLGVFIEETIALDIEKMNAFGSVEPESKTITVSPRDSLDKEKMKVVGLVVPERKTITVRRKEVPWYLDDGTTRVYVCGYQGAQGFYDTLKEYFSTEPITDVDCQKCLQVLEIGTYLTVVGRAVRDKDGARMIGQAYQFFNGHIQLDEFVTDLKSDLESDGTISLCVIALGVVLLALKII